MQNFLVFFPGVWYNSPRAETKIPGSPGPLGASFHCGRTGGPRGELLLWAGDEQGGEGLDFWGHLKTVHRHRALVRKHCFRLGLYWQGLTHDLSKYAPVEFWPGVKYFQGDHSPNELQQDGSGIGGVEMPPKYVAEMFCDRLAASKVYKGGNFDPGDPYKFFERGKGRRLLLHPATAALLERILVMLRDEGEDAAFAFVRREVLGKK